MFQYILYVMFIYMHVCLEASDLLVKMIFKNNSKFMASEQAGLVVIQMVHRGPPSLSDPL